MAEEKKTEENPEIAELKESVRKLTEKNRELLDEKRATKSGSELKLAEAQDKLEQYEAQIAKYTSDAKKSADKYAADLKAAQDGSSAKSAKLAQLIRDEGLTKELVAVGVKKEYLGAVTALLRDRFQVDEEKGEAYTMVKDAKGVETRKTVAEFAKDWGPSDEGKPFVTVPPSSGGGASAPGATSGAAAGTRDQQFMKVRSEQGLEAANRWLMAQPPEQK